MEYLFSYGTLQRDDVQIDLFGRLLIGSEDVLNGYRTVSVEITDPKFLARGEAGKQLTVAESEGDSIRGTAFEVTAADLEYADSYEPDGYRRIQVTLESGKEAWLYISDLN